MPKYNKPSEKTEELFTEMTVTIRVWDKGISKSQMITELKRISELIGAGYSGDVVAEDNCGGWWGLTLQQPETGA